MSGFYFGFFVTKTNVGGVCVFVVVVDDRCWKRTFRFDFLKIYLHSDNSYVLKTVLFKFKISL